MANLSNINNKFLVTTGGNILIGQTAAVGSSLLQVTGNSTFAGEIRTSNRLAIKETYFGYSSGYKVIQVGESAATKSISLGYDPSGNASGSFSGNEILIPNNIRILAPAANNSGYYGLMMLNSSNKVLLGSSNYLMESNYIMALDTATKNVGIGTASPEQKLHVEGASITVNRGNDDSSIAFQNSTSNATWRIGRDYSNSEALTFAYSATDYPSLTGNGLIYIDTSGNVGIGVTPWVSSLPNTVIDINPVASIWGYANSVYLNSNAYYNNGWLYKSTASAGVLQVDGNILRFRAAASGTADAGIAFDVPFIVDSTGNVGIGNAAPRDKLTVFTAGAAEEEIGLRLVNPVGFTNVGSGASIIFAQDRNTGENLPMAKIRSSQGIAGTSSYGDLIFSTLSSTMQDRMTILSNGNVGIGVTPTQKLDVAGIVKHQGLDMTAGVQVDQTTSISLSLSGAAGSWHETGIDGTDIGNNGSYMIQVYSNTQGAGASNYSMYWTGTMSWYAFGTNSVNTSEIYLNSAGHYRGMDLELRTISSPNSATPPSMRIQFKSNQTLTGHAVVFKFRSLM